MSRQERFQGFLEKVGKSSLFGMVVFLVLMMTTTFVIVPLVEILLPPEQPPFFPSLGRGAIILLSAIPVNICIASFAAGWWGTNAQEYSSHGLFSGFILGFLAPFVLFLISGKSNLISCAWGLGIPAALIGYVASGIGSEYHRMRYYRRSRSNTGR